MTLDAETMQKIERAGGWIEGGAVHVNVALYLAEQEQLKQLEQAREAWHNGAEIRVCEILTGCANA